jgi:L-arabinonolactonase
MSLITSPRILPLAAPAAPLGSMRQAQCLRWDGATARWWWADGAAGTLRAWSHDSQLLTHCALPDEAGAFAHCSSGRLLLCQPKRLCLAAAPTGTQARTPRAWRLRPLAAVDPAEPRTSIHDGRTDRRGFFVFGTRNDGADARPIGSFYQYSRQYGLRRLALPAVTVAASICFSVDGSRMYFADGAQSRILQCDYDAESAGIANVRPFADAGAMPEGALVDRDGNLWSAQAGAGRLVQYAPDGSVARRFALPWGAPASPAFGGDALDQLAVASADGLIRIPNAGVAGMRDVLFDDR